MYADGETETLHLCLQSFMWLDDQPGDGSGELIHNAPTVRVCLRCLGTLRTACVLRCQAMRRSHTPPDTDVSPTCLRWSFPPSPEDADGLSRGGALTVDDF
jgi:hypothetical protein